MQISAVGSNFCVRTSLLWEMFMSLYVNGVILWYFTLIILALLTCLQWFWGTNVPWFLVGDTVFHIFAYPFLLALGDKGVTYVI